MVTIKDIALKTGVSIAAVSKALNHLPGISAEKAKEILDTAEKMGYFPNTAARMLKTNRSYNIGIVYENRLAHEYFSQVLEAVRNETSAKGYDLTFLSSEGSNDGYYEHAMRRQCDGIIVAQGNFDKAELDRLAASTLPLVAIDQQFDGHTEIVNDNVGSTEDIVKYLHEMGHERIGYIHGEDGEVTRQRLTGFDNGCAKYGIKVPKKYVIAAKFQEPKDSGLATRRLLALKDRPTCIIYPDDISYLGGLTEMEHQHLSIPDDCSCVGYDGIRLSRLLRPNLATYHQNAEEIGRRAAEELIKQIEHPQNYKVDTYVIKGNVQPGATVKDLTVK